MFSYAPFFRDDYGRHFSLKSDCCRIVDEFVFTMPYIALHQGIEVGGFSMRNPLAIRGYKWWAQLDYNMPTLQPHRLFQP